MPPLLLLAIEAAKPHVDTKRRAYIGAVGLRHDKVIVQARNGSATSISPCVHAEVRLLRKAGHAPEVYVARLKKNGETAMARPCARCRASLRNAGVKFVSYTKDDGDWAMEAL